MNKRTILFVEDSDADFVFFSEYLRRLGNSEYDIVRASTGEDALRLARQLKFDCIILDYILPTLSGIEVLRDLIKAADCPVLFLTAYGNEIIADDVQYMGAAACFSKQHVSPVEIHESISRLVA